MTKPLDPADPAVISALVDRLLANARSTTPKPALHTEPRSPVKKAAVPPKPTPTPVKRAAAPRPMPKDTQAMKIIPKKAAAKTRRPNRFTKPKRRGYEVAIPAELLSEPKNYWPEIGTPQYGTPATRSAHDLEKGITAPCHTCGGECDEKEDRWGNWRRHRECLTVTQPWQRLHAAAVWYAIPEVTENEAWSATGIDVPDYADSHPSPHFSDKDADRSPWSHVRMKDVAVAVLMARHELAEVDAPGESTTGQCAYCGVAESDEWADEGHRRTDGSPAPLCATCWPYFDKYPGSADYWTDQSDAIAEAISGVPSDMGEERPAGLLAHAEVGGGDGTPWSHLDPEAVEAFRWSRWARAGGAYAPDEHRAEALARLAALEADRAARVAETTSADPYGFSGSEREAGGS